MDEQEKSKLETKLSKLSRQVGNEPGNAELYFLRGIVYAELGRNEEAIRDYDQAINLNSDFAEAYINRGVIKFEQKNYQDAINDYTQAINLNPNYTEAHNNRGNAKLKQKNYQDAINDYTQAITLKPDDPEPYYNRGNAKFKQKNYQDAINDYDQAIELNPNYANAYYNRGVTKEAMGLPEEAKEDFKKANQLDPMLFFQESAKDIKEEIREEVRESDEKVAKVQNFQDILDDLRKTYRININIWSRISVLIITITSLVLFGIFPSPEFLSDLVAAISIKVFFLGLASFCLAMYRDSRKLYLEAANRLAMAKLLENIRGNENLEPEIKNLAYPQLFSAIIYKLNPTKSKGSVDKDDLASLTQFVESVSHFKK